MGYHELMAVAVPVMQQWISTKIRVRGGGIIGIPIGIGIGVGSYLIENFEFTTPFRGNILNPPGRKPGGQFLDASQKNVGTYHKYQTLHKLQSRYRRNRRNKQLKCRHKCFCC